MLGRRPKAAFGRKVVTATTCRNLHAEEQCALKIEADTEEQVGGQDTVVEQACHVGGRIEDKVDGDSRYDSSTWFLVPAHVYMHVHYC